MTVLCWLSGAHGSDTAARVTDTIEYSCAGPCAVQEDDVHEEWDLPDAELVFRVEKSGEHKQQVMRCMLPSL